MENWKDFIKKKLLPELKGDSFWEEKMKMLEKEVCPYGVHLVIFNEPYLSFIFQGKKTVESRFSINKIAPYKNVYDNDIMILKISGGPVIGICQISDIWHYKLDPKTWITMRKEYTDSLCAQDPNFWKTREKASYATLIKMRNIKKIMPLAFIKNDRRGWVVLNLSADSKKALDNNTVIIALSGKIASGKSTLSKALSQKLSWPSISFGNYIRNEAKIKEMKQDRETLQQLGEKLLKDPEKFCYDVLSSIPQSSTPNIIIDGIRHKSVIDALYKIRPKSKIIFVYIDIKENIRLERLKKRDSRDYVNLINIESHYTENDVKKILKKEADIIVDGGMAVSDIIHRIIAKIEL